MVFLAVNFQGGLALDLVARIMRNEVRVVALADTFDVLPESHERAIQNLGFAPSEVRGNGVDHVGRPAGVRTRSSTAAATGRVLESSVDVIPALFNRWKIIL